MQKLFFLLGLLLFAQNGLFAQCLSNLNCPTTSQTICDTSLNDHNYWNDTTFNDPVISNQDLGETPANLSMQIIDSCGTGDIQVSFVLLLDLDGDGVRETAISSDSLPEAGVVYYGNAANPNYTGGVARPFDTRDVPDDQKYRFALERVVQDSLLTVQIRWTNALAPNDYVLPELPYGTHSVEWRFEKNGEVKTCGYDFVVKDCQPPTVTCSNPFYITIENYFTQTAQLFATDIVSLTTYPHDNYSNNLVYGIRRSGTGTGFPLDANGQAVYVLTFGCDDIDLHYLELWVKDFAGNASFCETHVVVYSAPTIDCGMNAPNPIIKACAVNHCNGEGITDVSFDLSATSPTLPPFVLGLGISDSIGCYTFDNNIPLASNFTITPVKDDNPLNGVSTFDLVLISKHILGVQPLSSPYKMIAADANRSGSITSYDIVELRKLILGIYQELPNNTSWRFVDSSFVFPNPNNPFQTVFPNNVSVGTIQTNLATFFYGIKIGDVNCTALANFATTPSEEALIIPDFHLQTDEIVEVPIRFSQAGGYQGFQFGLHFDPTQVEILGITPDIGTKDNFAIFPNHVNVSWSDMNSNVFLPDESLFHIRVKALVPLELADVFRLNTEKIHAEAYSENDRPVNLRLQFTTNVIPETNITQQIFAPIPNPTTAGVRIPVRLEESETVVVEILDVTGRVTYQQKQAIADGAKILELPAHAFPQGGVYIWRVQAGATSRTGKIVKQ